MNIPHSIQQESSLQDLSEEVEKSSNALIAKFGTFKGRLSFALHRTFGSMPDCAKRHIELNKQLRKAIFSNASEHESDLLKSLSRVLSEKDQVLQELSKKVDYAQFLSCIKDQGPFVDENRLFKISGIESNDSIKSSKIPKSRYQWYQNLALLLTIYKRTNSHEIKHLLSFFVYNYLAKAAPICPRDLSISNEQKNKLLQLFQLSLFEPGVSYNRESNHFDQYLRESISQQLAPLSGNILYFIDTKEIKNIFPLWYTSVDSPACKESAFTAWSEAISDKVHRHLSAHPKDYAAHFFDPPLLIDLTSLLEEAIVTSGDKDRNEAFEEKMNYIERLLEKAIDDTVIRFADNWEEAEALKLLVILNLTCICRCDVKSISILKELPLFHHPLFFSRGEKDNKLLKEKYVSSEKLARDLFSLKIQKSKAAMEDFLNGTGLRLGAVHGRQKIFDFISLEQFIDNLSGMPLEYSVHGENSTYFKDKLDLTETSVFIRLENFFFSDDQEDQKLISSRPYLEILGNSTIQMIKGLLTEIDPSVWLQLNEDPDYRALIQTALFKINIQLAKVEMHLSDFSKFSDCIELIHYEIAVLLTLFFPFAADDFPMIYKNRLLESIPEELHGFLKAGLTKSAMNTFAGLNVALRESIPDPAIALHEGSHFEIVQLIGKNREFSNILQDPSVKSVDLFLGEFNHNVRLIPAHDEYTPGDVIADVTALLNAKPETEYLTVAIDSTIDFINSSKAKEVLTHFSEAIREGKLNFVFFRSGQKFDMFGMDNYYGSPWYMINNGMNHWKSFDILLSEEAFKTDELSKQWFCLANKYAPKQQDFYRKALFENTKEILKHVPKVLLPGGNPLIKVCTVAEGMEPCFLDIKCYGEHSISLVDQLEKTLYKIFTKSNVKIHSRGGYGYINPNINLFIEGLDCSSEVKYSTMRLHPGINDQEIDLYIQFLQYISENLILKY